MTTSTRSLKKTTPDALPGALQGIDRVFGRDLRSQGWVIDLTRISDDLDGRGGRADDDTPDPAMIWVLRGRRR